LYDIQSVVKRGMSRFSAGSYGIRKERG